MTPYDLNERYEKRSTQMQLSSFNSSISYFWTGRRE
jgi:hypothetical protein